MKTKTVQRPTSDKRELQNGNGSAPASGAVFRALAENPDALKRSQRSGKLRAQKAGREACPATPGAGVLPKNPLWQLRLYVTGQTDKSLTAFVNLKSICESQLNGHYHITVIDLLKQPQLAKGDQILAIPTVVRKLPKPVRTIIGTLSNTDHLLVGLDLRAAK